VLDGIVHTCTNEITWWEVELSERIDIDVIYIWNRPDYYRNRLEFATLYLYDDSTLIFSTPLSGLWETSIAGPSDIIELILSPSTYSTTKVKIESIDTVSEWWSKCLNFREVEVFGKQAVRYFFII
jgi:hypothetical protein